MDHRISPQVAVVSEFNEAGALATNPSTDRVKQEEGLSLVSYQGPGLAQGNGLLIIRTLFGLTILSNRLGVRLRLKNIN